jgi:hypothetical protein
MIEIKHFTVPFLIAVFQMLFAALAIGMLPGLWVVIRSGRWGMILKWTIVTAIAVMASVYALPLALHEWKAAATTRFHSNSLWMGYLLTLLFVPMIIPEPLRMARRRTRKEQPEEKTRRKRRKRRSQQLPGEMKLR